MALIAANLHIKIRTVVKWRLFMALDGTVIASVTKEMNTRILGGRISKIAQPEADELLLTIKSGKKTEKLLISASAGLPLIYFTNQNKPNPLTAPNFCMLLRKHIGNGRIISITQPSLERIIDMEIEHLNELGDLCRKHLIVELMGKHSNIIFCNDSSVILDSIKHVPSSMSSVREVLPGRPYFIPDTMGKQNPMNLTLDSFLQNFTGNQNVAKTIYTHYTGISPLIAEEIVFRSKIDSSKPASECSEVEKLHLGNIFLQLIQEIQEGRFVPNIIYKGEEPIEFSCILLDSYSSYQIQTFSSISEVLETYYATRNLITRIRQKSAELRRVVQTHLERSRKKYDLQLKQLKDTQKREKYRIYGELLNTYGYEAKEGDKQITVLNYYTNEPLTIPLNPDLSAQENAKKYFERYNKLKRTNEALSTLLTETEEEIAHLESISTSIDMALSVDDLTEIRQEMVQYGYIKKHAGSQKGNKKLKILSKPYHYISSDGFDIYVGKNNYQNEELTFHFAEGRDIWMHAKKIPGSHVIIRTNGKEVPDRTYEEAGQLAAYYSKSRNADKVEIDYIEKKHVKKTAGGKPGFVIYHTNYSLLASPNIKNIQQVES